MVPNAVEILPKIWAAWVGRTNVSDDRQTDGRATANSEREREFTFAKTVSGKVVAQSIVFRVVSIYWQGVAPFPWYLNAKGSTPIGSTCIGSRDVIASLACVRLTRWPVAWNWRRAVLSADAGLLVIVAKRLDGWRRHLVRKYVSAQATLY